MAQQTTLIPLAARTSTLIVDSDLDLGAFELIADKVVADSGSISQLSGDYVETDLLQIPASRIIPGNKLLARPTPFDPVVLGYQTPKKLAEWSMPTLHGSDNEFDLKCDITAYLVEAPDDPRSSYISWDILVDGDTVKSGISPTYMIEVLSIDEHIVGVSSLDVITIRATSSNTAVAYKNREAVASNIEIIGDLEAFRNVKGKLVLQE